VDKDVGVRRNGEVPGIDQRRGLGIGRAQCHLARAAGLQGNCGDRDPVFGRLLRPSSTKSTGANSSSRSGWRDPAGFARTRRPRRCWRRAAHAAAGATVPRPGLEQQDVDCGGPRSAGREHAPGRARAEDDVVEHAGSK
jgi:hypothetical protein